MKWASVLLFVVLTLGMTAPVAAWGQLNDSQQPGSVLVFYKFRHLPVPDVTDTDFTSTFSTQFQISVTCPRDSTCLAFQPVTLEFHWVCPGPPSGGVCTERNFVRRTTVNGSILLDTNSTPPPCPKGYLIAWVIDTATGARIKFDGLLGNALIRETEGVVDNAIMAYNALPIQASDNISTGDGTDVNADLALNFDGSEYKTVTGRIFGTVAYENLPPTMNNIVETFLTLLTLDVQSNRPNNPTFVDLNFYNEFEVVKSASTNFTCWTEIELSSIDATLTQGGFGRRGLVASTRAEKVPIFLSDTSGPATLVGIIETEEETAAEVLLGQYVYPFHNDGTPVPTTFVPND